MSMDGWDIRDETGPEKVDADRGIYHKYVVFKAPTRPYSWVSGAVTYGEDEDGNLIVDPLEEVEDFTFTLRPSKDYHARVALAAYAESVRHWNPQLAQDIDDALDLIQSQPPRMEPT